MFPPLQRVERQVHLWLLRTGRSAAPLRAGQLPGCDGRVRRLPKALRVPTCGAMWLAVPGCCCKRSQADKMGAQQQSRQPHGAHCGLVARAATVCAAAGAQGPASVLN